MGFIATLAIGGGSLSFHCRRLTRGQLRSIDRLGSNWQRSEQVLRWSCPEVSFGEHPAGVTLALAAKVVELSQLENPEAVYVEECRRSAEDPEWVRNIMIVTAFPQYKFRDLEDLTWTEWIQLSARADWKLLNFHGMTEDQIRDLLQPEEAEKRRREEEFQKNVAAAKALFGEAPAATQATSSLFESLDPDVIAAMEAAYAAGVSDT